MQQPSSSSLHADVTNVSGLEWNMSVTGQQDFCSNASTSASEVCRKTPGTNLSTPILMMAFGVVGNILALLVLYSSRKEAQARRTVFFVMLAGLAWTDLIGQVAVGPIAIIMYANNLRWVGGVALCRYHGFMMVSFGLVTPLIVCCMSMERFLAIRFCYYYARRVSRRKAQMAFLACWGFTVAFASLPFVGFGSYEHQFPGSWCFLNFHRESTLDTIYAGAFSCLNVVAIVIMVICNVIVGGTLLRMRHSRRMKNSASIDRKMSVSGIAGSTSGTVIRMKRHSDMEAQMIWFLGLITTAFTICWLPLNVHILKMQFYGSTNHATDLMVIRMASTNQILDPWLYVIFRKSSFLRIVRRIMACFYPVVLRREPPPLARQRPNRYVICNRSFTCEATTMGRTVNGVIRLGESPSPIPRRLVMGPPYTCENALEKNKASPSDDSADSNEEMVAICAFCDEEDFEGHVTSNPTAELCTGSSPTEYDSTLTGSPFGYHVCSKHRLQLLTYANGHLTNNGGRISSIAKKERELTESKDPFDPNDSLHKSLLHVASLPLLIPVISKQSLNLYSRAKEKYWERFSSYAIAKDCGEAYHSLDSAHQSTICPSNNFSNDKVKQPTFTSHNSTQSLLKSPPMTPIYLNNLPSFSSPSGSISTPIAVSSNGMSDASAVEISGSRDTSHMVNNGQVTPHEDCTHGHASPKPFDKHTETHAVENVKSLGKGDTAFCQSWQLPIEANGKSSSSPSIFEVEEFDLVDDVFELSEDDNSGPVDQSPHRCTTAYRPRLIVPPMECERRVPCAGTQTLPSAADTVEYSEMDNLLPRSHISNKSHSNSNSIKRIESAKSTVRVNGTSKSSLLSRERFVNNTGRSGEEISNIPTKDEIYTFTKRVRSNDALDSSNKNNDIHQPLLHSVSNDVLPL